MIHSLNEQFKFGNGGGGVEPTALINTSGTVFPIIVCLYNVLQYPVNGFYWRFIETFINHNVIVQLEV